SPIRWSCPICCDAPDDVAYAMPCGHRFCLGCILRWAERNPACPLCRRSILTVKFSDHASLEMENVNTLPLNYYNFEINNSSLLRMLKYKCNSTKKNPKTLTESECNLTPYWSGCWYQSD
uniref:RING-type domain-containing protein n=1 Tax=Zonotrichia albicollis TaxID=44394 RepID=A0A8D2M277_ZONAL